MSTPSRAELDKFHKKLNGSSKLPSSEGVNELQASILPSFARRGICPNAIHSHVLSRGGEKLCRGESGRESLMKPLSGFESCRKTANFAESSPRPSGQRVLPNRCEMLGCPVNIVKLTCQTTQRPNYQLVSWSFGFLITEFD